MHRYSRTRPVSFAVLTLIPLFIASVPSAAVADTPLSESRVRSRPNAMQGFTIQDLANRDKFEAILPMVPGDGYFGMAPRFSIYGGFENVSLGFIVPMSVLFPDNADEAFVLGNLTFDIKGRLCRERRGVSICFAGGLATGVGFFDIDNAQEVAAALVALTAYQDPVYAAAESVVVRPIVATQITGRYAFFQAEMGVPVAIPMIDTAGRDTNVFINWALAAGVSLVDLIQPVFEFRAIHQLSGLESNLYFINVGARLLFGPFLPHLRLGIPLNDAAQIGDTNDIQVEVGATFTF